MTISKIVVCRVDPDTICTAFFIAGMKFFRVPIVSVRGTASAEDLADPTVLCIECGGDGQVQLLNFDHHSGSVLTCASMQAWRVLASGSQAKFAKTCKELADYISDFDAGTKSRHERSDGPTLSWLMAGMLLCIDDDAERMRAGICLFDDVVREGLNPYGSMAKLVRENVEYSRWLSAKQAHERHAKVVAGQVRWIERNGMVIAAVSSSWFGTPGLMEGLRSPSGKAPHITISLDPEFDKKVKHPETGEVVRYSSLAGIFAGKLDGLETVSPGRAKFTVTGAERLDELCEIFNNLDLVRGWGGPAHKTIIGSDKDGSSALTFEQAIAGAEKYCDSLAEVWQRDQSSSRNVVPFYLKVAA